MSDFEKYLAAILSGDTSGLPEPNTNVEKFIAKALGVWEGELPPVISDIDKLLAILAAKGLGEDFTISDASYLFYGKARLEAADALIAAISECTGMTNMFSGCTYMDELPKGVKDLDTSRITSLASTFANCGSTKEFPLGKWDTSNVLSLAHTFSRCYAGDIDVSGWDTSKVTSMQGTFRECSNADPDLSNWDTSKVTTMEEAFYSCAKLSKFPSHFNTASLRSLELTFYHCDSLVVVDMSSWDTSNISNMSQAFAYCAALEEIIGYSACNRAGLGSLFTQGSRTIPAKLRRLTFRTDLPEGTYAIRSAINLGYCWFTREGLVEMFNTLPDVSGLGLSTSYTTITLTGNPGITGTYTFKGNTGGNKTYATPEEMKALFKDYPGEATIEYGLIPAGTNTLSYVTDTVDNMRAAIDAAAFPARLYWKDTTYPCEDLLTDEDRAIATGKGWTLVE